VHSFFADISNSFEFCVLTFGSFLAALTVI
jgi:hypothetical protein